MNNIEKMCRDHFNEPIILGSEIVRLIGFGEDERDYYLISRRLSKAWGEVGNIHRHTAVGGYIFLDRLKGQGYVRSHAGEDWDDYFRLDSLLTLNGCPKEAEFIFEPLAE